MKRLFAETIPSELKIWELVNEYLENELLARYTTFHMGGIVKKMYIPQNVDELLRLMGSNPQAFDYCIGGGSNLLINDEAVFDEAVNLREFNKRFENLGGGNSISVLLFGCRRLSIP